MMANEKHTLNFGDFKQRFMQAISDKTEETTLVYDRGDKLVIKRKDSEQVFFLENAWARYNEGETIDIIINTMIKPLFSVNIKDLPDMKWEQVKGLIYPQIKDEKSLLQGNLAKAGIIYKTGIIPLLAVCYVADIDSGMMYVTHDILKNWGADLETLHEQAILNLKSMNKGLQRMDGQHGEVFFASNTMDSYDCSRILDLDYDTIKSSFKGDVLIAVPNRDFLLVFDSAASYIPIFFMLIMKDYHSKPYPISMNIFKWDGKSFQAGEIRPTL